MAGPYWFQSSVVPGAGWLLASFAVIVPGHGRVTTLTQARADTRGLLKALRAHMGKAVEAGTDISASVKSFDAAPFKHLKHADVWIPQLANRTYLEMEME